MSDVRVVRPEALSAWNQLGAVLTDLRTEGAYVPCWADPDPFTSEDHRERKEAAQACLSCPALAACERFASTQQEAAHVWAGIDRSPRPIKRKEVA